MAVFQVAEAFALFTDVTPDVGRMLADFERLTAGEAPALVVFTPSVALSVNPMPVT